MARENKILCGFAYSGIAVNISCHELSALHLDQIPSVLSLADYLVRAGQVKYDLGAVLNVINGRARCNPKILADLDCEINTAAAEHSAAEADIIFSHYHAVIQIRRKCLNS